MKLLIKFLATGLYSGLSPWAPGTAGSLLYCVLFAFSIKYLDPSISLLLVEAVLISICGYLVSKSYLSIENNEDSDPKEVVIDEWAGMAISLIPIAFLEQKLWALLAAFILFRIFDIAKPWPVSKAEKLPGALGVMADDVCAGMIAALIMSGLALCGVLS